MLDVRRFLLYANTETASILSLLTENIFSSSFVYFIVSCLLYSDLAFFKEVVDVCNAPFGFGYFYSAMSIY